MANHDRSNSFNNTVSRIGLILPIEEIKSIDNQTTYQRDHNLINDLDLEIGLNQYRSRNNFHIPSPIDTTPVLINGIPFNTDDIAPINDITSESQVKINITLDLSEEDNDLIRPISPQFEINTIEEDIEPIGLVNFPIKSKSILTSDVDLQHNKVEHIHDIESYNDETEIRSEIKHEFKPEIRSEFKPEIRSEIKHEFKPEIRSEFKPEIKHEFKPEIKHEFKPEIKHEFKPEIKHEFKPEIKHEFKPEIRSEFKPEIKHEFKPEIKPEIKHNTQTVSSTSAPKIPASFSSVNLSKPLANRSPVPQTTTSSPVPQTSTSSPVPQTSTSSPVPQTNNRRILDGIFTDSNAFTRHVRPGDVECDTRVIPTTSQKEPEIKVPNYTSLSTAEQAKIRADFHNRFETLRSAWPELTIPNITDMTLEEIHIIYERFIRHIHISNNVSHYKIWLVIIWLFIELIGIKLGLNINGYHTLQMRSMNRYERLLVELGETNYTQILSDGSGQNEWPVWIRIAFISLVNAVLLILVKTIASYMHLTDINVDVIVNTIGSYLSGSPVNLTPANNITENNTNPNVSAVPENNNIGAMLGLGNNVDLAGMLGQFGGIFMNMMQGRPGPDVRHQQSQPHVHATGPGTTRPAFTPVYED